MYYFFHVVLKGIIEIKKSLVCKIFSKQQVQEFKILL